MSYPPQPGYPSPYGGPPPGYGHHPYGGRPSTALAYLLAGLFLACGGLALITAIISWSGDSDEPEIALATIGAAFTEDATGNIDFAIASTMTVACTTLTFALLMFSRLNWVRWILAGLGVIITLYYVWALIWILTEDAGEYIAVALIAWLLWLAATVVALLPHTTRAMRGRQNQPPPGYPPAPGYPPPPPPPGYPPAPPGYPPPPPGY